MPKRVIVRRIYKALKKPLAPDNFRSNSVNYRNIISVNQKYMQSLDPIVVGSNFTHIDIPQVYSMGDIAPKDQQTENQILTSMTQFEDIIVQTDELVTIMCSIFKKVSSDSFYSAIENLAEKYIKKYNSASDEFNDNPMKVNSFLENMDILINSYSSEVIGLVIASLSNATKAESGILDKLIIDLKSKNIDPFSSLSFSGGGGSGMVMTPALKCLIEVGSISTTKLTRGASIGALQALAVAFNGFDPSGYGRMADSKSMSDRIKNNATDKQDRYAPYCSTDYQTHHIPSWALFKLLNFIPFNVSWLHGFEMMSCIDEMMTDLINERKNELIISLKNIKSNTTEPDTANYINSLIIKMGNNNSLQLYTFRDLSYLHRADPKMFSECEMMLCYKDSNGTLQKYVLNAKNSPDLPLSVGARASAGFPKLFRPLFIKPSLLKGLPDPGNGRFIETLDGGALNNEPSGPEGLNQLLFLFAKQAKAHDALEHILMVDDQYNLEYMENMLNGKKLLGDDLPIDKLQLEEVKQMATNLMIGAENGALRSVSDHKRFKRFKDQTIFIPHYRFGVLAGTVDKFTPRDIELNLTEAYVKYHVLLQINHCLIGILDNTKKK